MGELHRGRKSHLDRSHHLELYSQGSRTIHHPKLLLGKPWHQNADSCRLSCVPCCSPRFQGRDPILPAYNTVKVIPCNNTRSLFDHLAVISCLPLVHTGSLTLSLLISIEASSACLYAKAATLMLMVCVRARMQECVRACS